MKTDPRGFCGVPLCSRGGSNSSPPSARRRGRPSPRLPRPQVGVWKEGLDLKCAALCLWNGMPSRVFRCQIPGVEAFVMSFESGTSLVLFAACLTALTALPANAETSRAAARQNLIQSESYDRLLETNRSFRQARMRRECAPISDPQLHQSCLDSFSQYEPGPAHATSTRKVASSKPARHTTHHVGSSTAPVKHQSRAGQ